MAITHKKKNKNGRILPTQLPSQGRGHAQNTGGGSGGGVLPSHWPIIPLLLPPHTKNKNGRHHAKRVGKGAGHAQTLRVGRGILPLMCQPLPPPLNPHHSYKMDDHWPTGGKRGRGHAQGRGYGGGACHLIGRAVPSNIHYCYGELVRENC
ncbi:hypothetical protein LSTR_LSTR011092 [Laodelphax striatellus]|uniref:Uncharacterized protein n=1 Tax=Laodelphax striatellus TaxID=195883 RepID=A0A482XHY1_LAOST|nr:hypothetical protein LSTR_LSTR011092 [Laodelphax striatellus]